MGAGHCHHHRHHNHRQFGAEAMLLGAATAVTAAVIATRASARSARQQQWQQPIQQQWQQPVQQQWQQGGRHCHGPAVVINQAPEPPLNMRSVSVAASEYQGSVLFYILEVFPHSGPAWQVKRRYNDFLDLCNCLGAGARRLPGAAFPKKQLLLAHRSRHMEARRQGLQLWLQRVLENPNTAGAWLRPLREFLEGGRQPLPARSTQLSDPAAPAALMEESSDSSVVLQIQVPPGVAPGQLLGVIVPTGRQLNVVLPDGAAAGDTLDFYFDAAAGTLAPLV